jgi:hypothetical protein
MADDLAAARWQADHKAILTNCGPAIKRAANALQESGM